MSGQEREALTKNARSEIALILIRRSNEVASFLDGYRRDNTHFGSVEMALSREIERLRRLADVVDPQDPEQDDEQH